jgi:RNA polymerase sigma-70 factor, ECF subfamily
VSYRPAVDLDPHRAARQAVLTAERRGFADASGPVDPDPVARDGASELPPAPASEVERPQEVDAAPSWDEIAERYGTVVFTMAYRLTGDRDEARDLAQDVFVRVYRNLDRYQPGTFEGWLYRITKNLFLDRVRRRKRVRLEPLPEEEWRQPSDLAPGPAERIESGMLRGDLEIALQELPPLFRTAVVLCDVQGLSYEEVAEATGWPLGTVRSRIHRGRRLLRRRLGGGARG